MTSHCKSNRLVYIYTDTKRWLMVCSPYLWLMVCMTYVFPSLVKVLEAWLSKHPPLVGSLPQSEHHCLQCFFFRRGGGGGEVHCSQTREGASEARGCDCKHYKEGKIFRMNKRQVMIYSTHRYAHGTPKVHACA